MLKIGLIAFAAAAVVGLGAFGAVQIASHSSDSQQSPTGNLVGQKEPGMPAETEAPSVPAETEEPSVPAETEEPSAPVETEEPSAPPETEAPSAPPETEQDVNDIIDYYYMTLSMFYQGNLDFMEDYMRPENKNTFNVNGVDMSAETAKEHKITLDLENGDTIDGITSKNDFFDVFKLWGAHQKTEMDDTSIVITFKDDEDYDYIGDEQLNSFKGTEIKVWLK